MTTLDEKLGGVITRSDLKNLHDSELKLFDSKHTSSQSQDLESRRHLLNGVPMPWMSKRSGSFPVCISRAQGAHLIDVDGNTLVDFCLGDTGALTGHALTEVNEAVSKQLQIGATTMMPSPDAAWIGAEVCALCFTICLITLLIAGSALRTAVVATCTVCHRCQSICDSLRALPHRPTESRRV